MKFVALAVVFLLAAGCQAKVNQADALSTYEHIRAAVVTYLTQAKESAQKAVDSLDDAEFKDFKILFSQDLDTIEAYIKSATESLAPVRERIGPYIVDLISAGYDNLSHELDEVCKELDPKVAELHQVLKKHLKKYLKFMDPVLSRVFSVSYEVVHEIVTTFKPVVKELQKKMKKAESKLSPILKVINKDMTKIFEELDSIYLLDLKSHWNEIKDLLTPLLYKCEELEPWKLLKTYDFLPIFPFMGLSIMLLL